MASVNEWIVREYFESLGFLVRQPTKYQVAGRPQNLEEEVDLLVLNPGVKASEVPALDVWDSEALKHVGCAIVGVRGWHTDRFSPAVLKGAPEVYRFAGEDVLDSMQKELGEGPVARILCLSELPASRTLQAESIAALGEQGIDGVLLYPHILWELIQHVEINRNYDKSDLLQLLRILKNYGLFRDEQLELFGKKRGGR